MKRFLFSLVFMLCALNSNAGHLIGGEITWTTNAQHQFIIHVTLYRDCNGNPPPNSIFIFSNTVQGGMLCNLVSLTDISPAGPGCPTCSNPINQANAAQEARYQSQPISIQGPMPWMGWYFEYNDCCRSSSMSNLSNQGNGSFTLRAIMYADGPNNTVTGTDNSPQFLVRPHLAACAGEFVNYCQTAYDPEFDSLSYSWAHPLQTGYSQGGPVDYPFSAAFSYLSPLPRTSLHPQNFPATLYPNTGIITFKSFTTGRFVTTVKVTSWKCGVKTAEIFRDIPIAVVSNCALSTQPAIQNISPTITILKAGVAINADTLTAGESASYTLQCSDLQYDSSGTAQIAELTAYSQHFGTNYNDTNNGCIIPPCATLSNGNPVSDSLVTNNTLHFPTSCAHAGYFNGCLQHSRDYQFIVKSQDNFCPVPGVKFKTFNICVTGPVISVSGNNLSVSVAGATFQWYNNGIAIPGATDSVFTPLQSGFYSLIATMPGGCDLLSNTCYWGITSVADINLNEIQNIYVDEHGRLQILFSSNESKQMRFDILMLNGKVVRSFSANVTQGVQHLSFEAADFATGIYLLRADDKPGGKKFYLK